MTAKENLTTKEQAYDAGYNDALSGVTADWDDQDSKAAYMAGYQDALDDQGLN